MSVVIPAYDCASFIPDTLSSVFAQTFADYEVIVVNDGSPDTPALEAAIAPWANRLVYLTQPNGGPSRARNLAIQHARAPYIAFLDSDDQWMPDFLASQMRMRDANPTLDLLYSNGVIFGETELAGCRLMDVAPSRGPVTFESLLAAACTVLTSCTVARRDALLEAGGFDDRFLRSEDFHLWLRLAFSGRHMQYNRDVLVKHRRREGSLASDKSAMRHAFIQVVQDLEARLPLTPAQRRIAGIQVALRQSELALEAGKKHFIDGDYRAATAALAQATVLEPRRWYRYRLRAVHAAMRVAPKLLRRVYDVLRPGRSTARVPEVSR